MVGDNELEIRGADVLNGYLLGKGCEIAQGGSVGTDRRREDGSVEVVEVVVIRNGGLLRAKRVGLGLGVDDRQRSGELLDLFEEELGR